MAIINSETKTIPKARAVYETAKRTRLLHIGSLALRQIPADVWSLGNTLLRLDLSSNLLTSLTPKIGLMVSLEQLWLNDNPFIDSIPSEIESCKKLKVIDLRRTRLSTLPREMGRLKQLIEVDLRETPMAIELGLADGINSKELVMNTTSLMEMLALGDKRETLRLEMFDRVESGVYREVASSTIGKDIIPKFVQAVCSEFSDCVDLQNVVRNADRLFPPFSSIRSRNLGVCALKLKEKYIRLSREIAKVKMSAELELKLRAIYYDVIDPESVEGVIKAVYEGNWKVEKALELEDIEFLIKHAPRLFPSNPQEITGFGVRAAVWALQDELINERQAVVDKLCIALSNSLYPEREPIEVAELATQVGRLFERDRFATKKELEDMKKLAADASQHFPSEFNLAVANPAAIKTSFKKAAAVSIAL